MHCQIDTCPSDEKKISVAPKEISARATDIPAVKTVAATEISSAGNEILAEPSEQTVSLEPHGLNDI